ncbi:MAG: chemotaxis protein CheA [Gammaproteobacteria bacterium]
MSIDLQQFHQIFFEESEENLEVMEQGLLSLDVGAVDAEVINTIFRAAHSIKGGSGTFGFTAAASFTHVMETLLDEVRAGKRQATRPLVDLLLRSVDCLRGILTATRGGGDLNASVVDAIRGELEQALNGELAAPAAGQAPASDHGSGAGEGWHIDFRPHAHMMLTGNDPLRIIKALSDLGEVEARPDLAGLPSLADMEPENCYLAWTILLRGPIARVQVDETFDWVREDCDLAIAPIEPPAASPAAAGGGAAAVQTAEAAQGSAESPSGERRQVSERRVPAAPQETSIRVGIDKIDSLINMVGELVITQSMLNTLSDRFDAGMIDKLRSGLTQLARNTRELQEVVLKIRMLPISFSFNRFPRLVRDLSGKLGKRVELRISGEQTELDKTVLEKIGDPLVHLVRNALDHGIEMPEVRRASGKPEVGTIHLVACHEGGNVVIEISDDGAGLNPERVFRKALERGLVTAEDVLSDDQIAELIFLPGFSTAEQVSDLSGRGVGMDVVRRNIKELGGSIEVRSSLGKGSRFVIRLPLTLAILDGQLVSVGDQTYIIPLVSIVESLQVRKDCVNSVVGMTEVYRLRDQYIPIVRLHRVLDIAANRTELEDGLLVVVDADGQRVGILVDDLMGQQQVVIKSLESNFQRIDGISGATILGTGTVAMILDIPGIVALSRLKSAAPGAPRIVRAA